MSTKKRKKQPTYWLDKESHGTSLSSDVMLCDVLTLPPLRSIFPSDRKTASSSQKFIPFFKDFVSSFILIPKGTRN